MAGADDRFRRQLGPALGLWVSEEIVTAEQAERLRAYYALDELSREAHGRFGAVLFGFGAILVGLGVISFVAANWDAIPRAARALGGLAVMAGLDVAGFKLWRQARTHRLGSALLLMGAFALGGNIALMAQWFQIGGSGWGLFASWSLGAAAMALALRHGLVGALAALCCLAAAPGLYADQPTAFALLPWVFAIGFVWLARWCDSRLTLYAALLGLASTVEGLGDHLGSVGMTAAAAALALAAWSWGSWHDARLPVEALPGGASGRPIAPDQDALKHAAAPRALAWLAVLGLLEAWGFREAWRLYDMGGSRWADVPGWHVASLGAFLAAALAAWGWTLRREADRVAHLGLGVVVALLVGLVALGARGVEVVVFENVLTLATTLGLAWLGLARGDRRWFWLGLVGLSFQVFARFLEYDTDLVAKSLVFTAWGLLLLGVGWGFERRLTRQEAPHA